MQAVRVWEEVGMLTNAATIKTEQLQILMDLAAEENTERILNSKGLQTKITSFKERWMEVAEMITSDRNNLTLKKKKKWKSAIANRNEVFFLSSCKQNTVLRPGEICLPQRTLRNRNLFQLTLGETMWDLIICL